MTKKMTYRGYEFPEKKKTLLNIKVFFVIFNRTYCKVFELALWTSHIALPILWLIFKVG